MKQGQQAARKPSLSWHAITTAGAISLPGGDREGLSAREQLW
jgi:hypothetical protein